MIRFAILGVKRNVPCYNAPTFAGDSQLGKPGNTGFLRVIRATRYSAQGLKHAWIHESAFRQEVTLTALLIPAGIWLGETPWQQLLLIGSCFFVLVVELLNSAVETAVDRISGESHELSGRAKDLGSAAVFLSLLMTGAIWGVVAWQRFMS